MIIGICGFSWSGSGAVLDFIRDFNETQVGESEFIFPYYPGSLVDLDFAVNNACCKCISSVIAFHRFKKAGKLLLEKSTKRKINSLMDEYISSLIDCKWVGSVQGTDEILKKNFCSRLFKKICWKFPKFGEHIRHMNKSPYVDCYLSIKPKDFTEKTQQFIDGVLASSGFNLNKNIFLDQPFPGNNPRICMKYFRDSKCIIVNRDPRDLYLLAKVYYKGVALSIPTDSVEAFINFYQSMRKMEENSPNILSINFEDLIYDFKNSSQKILDFCNLDEKDYFMNNFDPNKSINNTQLFNIDTKFCDDIKIIEKALSCYLYNFPYTYKSKKRIF